MHESSFIWGTDVPEKANEPAVAMVTKAAEAKAEAVPAPTSSTTLVSQLALTNKPLHLNVSLYPFHALKASAMKS